MTAAVIGHLPMNEWQKLRSRAVGVNDRMWVMAVAADIDQVLPFTRYGANVWIGQKLPNSKRPICRCSRCLGDRPVPKQCASASLDSFLHFDIVRYFAVIMRLITGISNVSFG